MKRIRELSMEAGRNVKEKGLENNLLELIAADDAFNLTLEELKTVSIRPYRKSQRTGRCLKQEVAPILE